MIPSRDWCARRTGIDYFVSSEIFGYGSPQEYKELAASCPNITFHEGGLVDAKLLNSADVLLSDASSVIVEAMMLDKPVVTYCNTMPEDHLLNVTETDAVEGAIEKAISVRQN